MKKNIRQKRVCLINDVTGLSRCSIAAMLPIISAMNIETVFVPTAILSVNTYHKNFYFDDYGDRMTSYIQTYKDMNIAFDGIATGFLGSAKEIDIVLDFLKFFKKDDTIYLFDPVMGDHGKIYATYTKEMQEKMKELLPYASIVTPNLTELCALLDEPYPSREPSLEYIHHLCDQLAKRGPQKIVVTGINAGDSIINYIYETGKEASIKKVQRIGEDRSGTGDVIAAVIMGNVVHGHDFVTSVERAADFALRCIHYSQDIGADNHLGLCFEPFLKELEI